MKLPKQSPRPVVFLCLAAAIVLAGTAAFHRSRHAVENRTPEAPRFSMSDLDAKALPFVEQANSAVPDVVANLCNHRCRLFWLLLKDKCSGHTRAREYISSAITPTIIEPLRKAAAVYDCAPNADAAVGMTTETALDNLSQQLYATAGLAIEAVFIKATIDSFIRILGLCAPRLVASWKLAGACAVADKALPVGDIIGLVMGVGGSLWCCHDIYRAYRALPSELASALYSAIGATVAQCRLEAAEAL